MSLDEAAIRERDALLLTRSENGLDPNHPALQAVHPDRRSELKRLIEARLSEGTTISGGHTYHIINIEIDGSTAELLACKWDTTELAAADGTILVPGDPGPLISTDRWVEEDGQWYSTGRTVTEEPCELPSG